MYNYKEVVNLCQRRVGQVLQRLFREVGLITRVDQLFDTLTLVYSKHSEKFRLVKSRCCVHNNFPFFIWVY